MTGFDFNWHFDYSFKKEDTTVEIVREQNSSTVGFGQGRFDPKAFQESSSPTIADVARQASELKVNNLTWTSKDWNGNWNNRRT